MVGWIELDRQEPGNLTKDRKTRMQISKSETRRRVQSRLDELHERIQSKLDELHSDFKQLETDMRVAKQESSKARKDRLEGFKRALRDILEAADRADREWH
jgi:hypothetical protein